jgi:hypothetical protein
MEFNKTVTISLEEYENMKNEIIKLKNLSEEHTVIKYIWHPAYAMAAIIIWISILSYFIFR